MAIGNTTTSADALLKYFYRDGVEDLVFQRCPLLGILSRDEKLGGKSAVYDVHPAAGEASGNAFSDAQTQAGLGGETNLNFIVPFKTTWRIANLSAELIASTQSSDAAFMKAATQITDAQLARFASNLNDRLYRTSDGNMGQIGSFATNVITLKRVKDANQFEIGMTLDLSPNLTGTTVESYSGTHGLYVMAVDRVNGKISCGDAPKASANAENIATTISSAANNDYIFLKGTKGTRMSGLQDWIPYGGVSSSDSFLNVNRSSDSVRLAGQYIDGTTGSSLRSLLEDAIALVSDQSANGLTHFMMSNKAFAQLVKEYDTKAAIVDVRMGDTGRVGVRGLEIVGNSGPVVCVADRSCPADTIMGINADSFKLVSAGPTFDVWSPDKLTWLRMASDGGMEMKWFSYANLLCERPVDNVNIKINP